MSPTKFEQIIGNPRIFKMILDEVMHDWPGSYDIMPVESPQDREIKDYEKFAEFCQKVRSNEEGLRRCMQCDLDFSKAAGKSGKPMHYLCHAGLMDIAVPIVVEGELIATIFCGQHRNKDADAEKKAVIKTKRTETELGFKQGELLKLRGRTPALPYNTVKDFQEKLLEVATYVSGLGSSKLEAERAKKELSARLRETDAIQNILLDLSEILDDFDIFWRKLDVVLEKICEIIGADFGIFVTCRTSSSVDEESGFVQSIANLPTSFIGRILTCNPVISNALEEMNAIIDDASHFRYSEGLMGELKNFVADPAKSIIAIVPIRLEPEKEGVMLFWLSESRDTNVSLNIKDEINLLTQAGTHIATAYGNCLLYQKQKELAEVQSDWLEDVSHQILAPITGIMGQAENLSESFRTWQKTSPQRIENTLQNLVELSNWATRMARNFAWVAKGQNHFSMNMMLEEDVPGRLIGYARNVQGLARTCEVYSVHVESESVKRLNGKIIIDNKLFKQAVTNLLDNAIKYADSGTNVIISAGISSKFGLIKITNYGIPILESEIEKIFSRYYRTEVAKNKYSVGSGIGLGIAREIMRFHSGDLNVSPSTKTENGWKTTFVISLPLVGSEGE